MYKYLTFVLIFLTFMSCQKGPVLGPGDDDQLASAAETDCGFIQNAYGQRVSWKKNIPIVLQIHKSYPPEYTDALKSAAHHWEEAAGMTLFRFEDADISLGSATSKDTLNVVYWQSDWAESQKNLQALTNLYWKGNQIYEADIAVDHKYYNFFIDTPTTFL